jgi:hypothetical protein
MAPERDRKPEPKKRPPPTEVPPTKADERRAQELIEKYGWQRGTKR